MQWNRTSPVAVVFFLLDAARQLAFNLLPAVVVVGAAYASGGAGRKGLMVAGVVILLVASVVGSILSWMRFRFRITDSRVLVRSGVIKKEEITVEFGRVQNINVREPFYMRPFGLVVLGIDTAGSNQKEIQLAGIPKDLALQIRETILSGGRPGLVDDASVDDAAAINGADPSLLLSRSTSDIVIYGLTVNFILWFGLAVAAILGAGEDNDRLLLWVADKLHLTSFIVAWENSFDVATKALWVASATVMVLLLLPLVSILGALFRHHDYRLSVEGETFSRRGGLLTRHEESLKQHKIQAAVLKQNFMARLFRRTNMQLRVAHAGVGTDSAQLPTMTPAFMVPALHPEELDRLLPQFLPGCDTPSPAFSRPHLRRNMIVILALTGLIALPASTILSVLISWKIMAIPAIVLLLAAFAVYRYWSKAGYAVVGDYGYVRHGFFGTTITAFPLFKIQRVDIVQSRGQKKSGQANLDIHLASHSLTVRYIDITDARTFRDLALYHAESSDRAWY